MNFFYNLTFTTTFTLRIGFSLAYFSKKHVGSYETLDIINLTGTLPIPCLFSTSLFLRGSCFFTATQYKFSFFPAEGRVLPGEHARSWEIEISLILVVFFPFPYFPTISAAAFDPVSSTYMHTYIHMAPTYICTYIHTQVCTSARIDAVLEKPMNK